MKYNIKNIPNKQNIFYFFYGHYQKVKNVIDKSCLSQWFDAPFYINGQRFANAECWMMYAKAELFKDNVMMFKISGTSDPKEAKRLGRLVKNYNEQVWRKHRTQIVIQGNIEKFKQNPELAKFLLSTNEKVLVEASKFDTIWGVGLSYEPHNYTTLENPEQWKGLNLLGFCLMEVRDELKLIGNGKE